MLRNTLLSGVLSVAIGITSMPAIAAPLAPSTPQIDNPTVTQVRHRRRHWRAHRGWRGHRGWRRHGRWHGGPYYGGYWGPRPYYGAVVIVPQLPYYGGYHGGCYDDCY
jgi:hypothetical protein